METTVYQAVYVQTIIASRNSFGLFIDLLIKEIYNLLASAIYDNNNMPTVSLEHPP